MHPRALSLRPRALVRALAFALLAVPILVSSARAQQQVNGFERDRWRDAMNLIKSDIKKNYYDPSYRGIDLDAHFKKAEEKMKQAQSVGQLFGIIAQALLEFDDSHLFFIPPGRASRFDYGWRTQVIGDRCFVTAVRPGSDAEAKGLKPGDVLHVIDGYKPTRENMWQLQYLYHALQPRPSVRLVIQSPGAGPRQVEVAAKVRQGKKQLDFTRASLDYYDALRDEELDESLRAHRHVEVGGDLFIWKMPQFDLEREKVDEIMSKARGSKALIIDLRGNGGGYEETLLRMLGNLFDRDVKLGDIQRRKETKPLIARTRGADAYKGKVILLVDSESASAAELLARVVQLEKRGTVVGDRTSGAVMRSRGYSHQIGVDTLLFYGTSVTDADIKMADGRSLEKAGVTPDEPALPTGPAMRAGRDPVLAFAATLAGVQLDSEKAGALFPVRWKQ